MPNQRSGQGISARGCLIALLALGACRIDPPTAYKTVDLAAGQQVVAVDRAWFGDAQTLRLTVNNTAGRRAVAAKLNPGNHTISSQQTGWFKMLAPEDDGTPLRDDWYGYPSARSPEAAAGGRPVRLDPGPRLDDAGGRGPATVNAAYTSNPDPTQPFYVYLDWNGNAVRVDAALVAQNASCNVWLYPAPNAADKPSWVDGAAANAALIADAFLNIVRPQVDSLFAAGVPPDGIDIVLFDIDSDYYDGLDSGIFGYFSASREDVIYLDGGFLSSWPYSVVSTLAHEYQHLLSYARYQAVFQSGPDTFLNELRSLAVEDLLDPAFSAFYGDGGSADAAYAGAYDFYVDGPMFRSERYFDSYLFTGLDYAADDANADFGLTDYAAAYLFAAYLLRAHGGAAFLSDWIDAGADAAALARATPDSNDNEAAGYGQYLQPFLFALLGLDASGAAPSPLAASTVPATEAGGAPYLRPFPPPPRQAPPAAYGIPASLADGPTAVPAGAIYQLLPRAFSLHANKAWQPLAAGQTVLEILPPANAEIEILLFFLE